MIVLKLSHRSGIPPYLQIVQQVKQAVKLGHLKEGDRLPTVKEAVGMVAVNPNTIAKAYRELESRGVVKGKAGVGTFVTSGPEEKVIPKAQTELTQELLGWIKKARKNGLDDEAIESLFTVTFRSNEED